jgi:hypothetical protein
MFPIIEMLVFDIGIQKQFAFWYLLEPTYETVVVGLSSWNTKRSKYIFQL